MKKRTYWLVFLLSIILALSSCFSIPKTHKIDIDETMSAERKATVTFINNITNRWFILDEWRDF